MKSFLLWCRERFSNSDLKFKEIKKINKFASTKYTLVELYKIIGLLQEDAKKFSDTLQEKHLNALGISESEIKGLIEERANAKAEKNYARADEIRAELDSKGIILNDSREGTTWDIKELYSI